MPKPPRGGQRAGGALSGGASLQQQTPPQAQQQQPQVDNTQKASAFGTDYNTFMAMTDDQKADVISQAVSQDVPVHLSQTDFQRFVYNSGLNDKPDVVDDATLNSMTGTEIFRTVNSVYDKNYDVSYTADQIALQVMAGRVTRTSDNGGSVYGRGIYFADNKSSSSAYGNSYGDVKKTAQVRAKLNSNAKIISHNNALTGVNSEISSGSKLGKALKKCDYDSQVSIYAMAKGYNVITSGNGYMNILNRNAITMSKTISPI